MGQGLPHPAPGVVPWATMFALPSWTGDEHPAAVATDWYLGGLSAPEPVEIPFSWLSGTIRFRQVKPYNYASVGKVGAGTAVAVAAGVVDEQVDFTESTATSNDVDAPNRAHHVVTYYAQSRVRMSQLRFVLNQRETTEIWTLLGVGVGRRVRLTGTPAGWPEGGADLVVEGVTHRSRQVRELVWSASPVIGLALGEVGPFFRAGVSTLGGDDLLPW